MRLPFLPTLIVVAAVATMAGLGIWQLQRAEWKGRLLAEMRSEGALDPVTLACAIDAAPEVRAGHNRAGEIGYRYLVPCRAGAPQLVDAGWSQRPDALPRVRASGRLTGVREPGGRPIVVLTNPVPPLAPSAPPTLDDIPNNHLGYALQWFLFAAAAAIIYALALARRRTH